MAYELTNTMPDTEPNFRMTRNSEEVIQAMMTDIQKAVDQLSHLSSFDDSGKFTLFLCAQPVDLP